MQRWFQCPGCGSSNYVGQQFCGNCNQRFTGVSQQETPGTRQFYSCSTCHQPVQYGANFCGYCGTFLNWSTEQHKPHFTPYNTSYQPEQINYQHGLEKPRKKKNPWLTACLSLIGIIVLTAIAVATINASLSGTPAYTPPVYTQLAPVQPQPLLPLTLSPESPTQPDGTIEASTAVFYDRQPPYVKTIGGPRINLVNNKLALDATWQQLMTFLTKDATDSKKYDLTSFPCGAFAEEVHNNAEAAGIRAAWVAVDFTNSTVGHALNAFNTTDRGLVFIDCTGGGRSSPGNRPASGMGNSGSTSSWDKIAYIEAGKEYGLISTSMASWPDYSLYPAYCEKRDKFFKELDSYNNEVRQYNQFVSGRIIYIGSAEYLKATQWEQRLKSKKLELNALANSLGAIWEPLGIVSKVKIYW